MTGIEAVRIIKSLGITQCEAAELLGLHKNTVTAWARGGDVNRSAQRLLRLLVARPELVHVLRTI